MSLDNPGEFSGIGYSFSDSLNRTMENMNVPETPTPAPAPAPTPAPAPAPTPAPARAPASVPAGAVGDFVSLQTLLLFILIVVVCMMLGELRKIARSNKKLLMLHMLEQQRSVNSAGN